MSGILLLVFGTSAVGSGSGSGSSADASSKLSDTSSGSGGGSGSGSVGPIDALMTAFGIALLAASLPLACYSHVLVTRRANKV
jgi:hypothetical protein